MAATINYGGKSYTPQELLELYNQHPMMAKVFIGNIVKSDPALAKQAVAAFNEAGIEIPAKLLSLLK